MFMVSVFNDHVSSSEYIAPNARMVNKNRIRKDVEGSGHGIISGIILKITWMD
jgi:hypothetical protein